MIVDLAQNILDDKDGIALYDVVLTCLPERLLQTCTVVTKKEHIDGRCSEGPVGLMRTAIARLNVWDVTNTIVSDKDGNLVDALVLGDY